MRDYGRANDKEETRGIMGCGGVLVLLLLGGTLLCWLVGWDDVGMTLGFLLACFATLLLVACVYAMANDY